MKHSKGFLALVKSAKRNVNEIQAATVRRRVEAGEKLNLFDVREDHEWKAGHVRAAKHLSRGILERDIEVTIPDKNAEIILYCGGGFRSALAAENLQRMGYKHILSMAGGWRRWNTLKYPIIGSRPAHH